MKKVTMTMTMKKRRRMRATRKMTRKVMAMMPQRMASKVNPPMLSLHFCVKY